MGNGSDVRGDGDCLRILLGANRLDPVAIDTFEGGVGDDVEACRRARVLLDVTDLGAIPVPRSRRYVTVNVLRTSAIEAVRERVRIVNLTPAPRFTPPRLLVIIPDRLLRERCQDHLDQKRP